MSKHTCECGAEMGDPDYGAVGCNGCTERALVTWAATRPQVLLPRNWWRRFEPWGGCGRGYYHFGRSDLTGKHEDPPDGNGRSFNEEPIVSACEEGVTLAEPPYHFARHDEPRVTFDFSHIKGEELDALLQVLALARADHHTIARLNQTDELAKLVSATSKSRRSS